MFRFTFVLIVSSVLLSIPGVAQESTFRFAAVDDKGDAVRDLKVEDIRVKLKSGQVSPTKLSFVADSPLSVLILIDASASQERMIPFEKKVAETVIDVILRSPSDQVGIAKFTGQIHLVHDLSTDFKSVKSSLERIRFEPPPGFVGGGVVMGPSSVPPAIPRDQLLAGSTSIFDSVAKAISSLSLVDTKGSRKIVLLISDGVNTFGDTKIKQVVESSTSAGIPIFSVGVGDTFYDGIDQKTLKKLSESTGGIVVIPSDKKPDELTQAISTLDNALRNFYVLTYAGASDIKDISIEIANPDLKKKVRVIAPRSRQ